MICRTCNAPTDLAYNNFPLCKQHYRKCVESKSYQILRKAAPTCRYLIFSRSLPCAVLCFDQVCRHIESFVKDPCQAIFILGMSSEWNDRFKSSVKRQSVQFINSEYTAEGASYYKLIAGLLDICASRNISYLVDGQSA